jgi:hypothetical protein
MYWTLLDIVHNWPIFSPSKQLGMPAEISWVARSALQSHTPVRTTCPQERHGPTLHASIPTRQNFRCHPVLVGSFILSYPAQMEILPQTMGDLTTRHWDEILKQKDLTIMVIRTTWAMGISKNSDQESLKLRCSKTPSHSRFSSPGIEDQEILLRNHQTNSHQISFDLQRHVETNMDTTETTASPMP